MQKLQGARDEASQGLIALQAEIDALRTKAEHLAKAIGSLDFVLGTTKPEKGENVVVMSQAASSIANAPNTDDAYRPMWELAREVLLGANRPLTVPEIDAVLVERGQSSKRDALRIAMIRRTDAFRRNGYGRWSLASWPDSNANSDLSHFDGEGNTIGEEDDETNFVIPSEKPSEPLAF